MRPRRPCWGCDARAGRAAPRGSRPAPPEGPRGLWGPAAPPGARRLPRGRDVGGVEVDVGVRQQHGLHPPRAQHLLAEAAAQHGHAPVLEGAAAGRHGGRPPPGRAGPGPAAAAAAPRSRPGPSRPPPTATLPPVSLNSRPQCPIGRGRTRPPDLISGDQRRSQPSPCWPLEETGGTTPTACILAERHALPCSHWSSRQPLCMTRPAPEESSGAEATALRRAPPTPSWRGGAMAAKRRGGGWAQLRDRAVWLAGAPVAPAQRSPPIGRSCAAGRGGGGPVRGTGWRAPAAGGRSAAGRRLRSAQVIAPPGPLPSSAIARRGAAGCPRRPAPPPPLSLPSARP